MMSGSDLGPGVPAAKNRSSRLVGYLRRHPVLTLFLLSPGIPEYLSGSTSLANIILNPPLFLLLLGLNTGLYLSGVLLIREAKLRWQKGWPSIFLLGFAYAIVEEGLALRTLYNPNSPVVGALGIYGHWLGVNWVWTIGLLLFHSIFSIALPILLFNLAFPFLSSKKLVSGRKLVWPITALALDTLILSAISNYWPGPSIMVLSTIAVGIFILAARKLPQDMLSPTSAQPSRGPRTLGLIGALFFPATLFIGGLAAGTNAPPLVPMILDVLVAYCLLKLAYRYIGREQNQSHKVGLAAGLLIPLAAFGLIASLGTIPLALGADASLILFTRRLWRRYNILNSRQFARLQIGIDSTRNP